MTTRIAVTAEEAADTFFLWVDQAVREVRGDWIRCFRDRLSEEQLEHIPEQKLLDLLYAALAMLGIAEMADITAVSQRARDDVSAAIYTRLAHRPIIFSYVKDFAEHGAGTRYYDRLVRDCGRIGGPWTLPIVCRVLHHLDFYEHESTASLARDRTFLLELGSCLLESGMNGCWRIFAGTCRISHGTKLPKPAPDQPKPALNQKRRTAMGAVQIALAVLLASVLAILVSSMV